MDRRRAKKWCLTAIKLAIVAVVFWFVRQTILEGFAKIEEHPPEIRPGWLVAAAALYLLGLLPAGLFWRRILRTLGQDAGLLETLRAYYIGHLGKYVPGKAMVVVLRTGLIRSHRVDTGIAAVSVFFETLTMMSVGAFLAAGVLALRFRDQTFLCLVACGLMCAAGLPILPPVFRRLARMAGVGRSNPAIAERLQDLRWRCLVEGVLAMTVCWLLLAASLGAVLQAIHADPLPLVDQFPLYLAAVSLAMVAGFLSLIPGGLGVRELVLLPLLGPTFGDAVAVVSAVLLRLVWLAAELTLSALLYFAGCKTDDTPAENRLE